MGRVRTGRIDGTAGTPGGRKRRRRGIVGAVSLLVPVLSLAAACGDDGGTATRADGDPALEDVVDLEGSEVEVEAKDNDFVEENIRVDEGTTVVWDNVGRQDHDVVPVDGDGWGIGPDDFSPGDAYERTFDEPGTYRYYCSLHGDEDAGMTGAVVVE